MENPSCTPGSPALPRQVLSNIDELFDRGELSAAPDPGWPDCFNSGVFVFRPSLETHGRLLQHASDHGSFDGRCRGAGRACPCPCPCPRHFTVGAGG